MKKLRNILILAVIAVLGFAWAQPTKLVKADPPPIRILTLCDSITQANQYQVELSRLLNDEGVNHVMLNGGVGGTGVEYWATNITSVMNTYQPDLVLLDCGTNDTWTVTNNVTNFEAKYRTVVEGILNWRPTNRVKLGLSYIAYAMPPATQSLISGEPLVNDAIYRQLHYYTPWITGMADFQQIPPNALYLDSSGYHPTARGYKAMGRIWYDALAPGMGWPTSSEAPLCGMDGAPMVTGYARRTPIACAGQ